MDVQVVVDTSQLDALVKRFGGTRAATDREARVALERSATIVQDDARARLTAQGAIDTGALLRDIGKTVTAYDARIGSNLPQALAVEAGRRAGAPPPPVDALKGWVVRHGMDEGAAYPIAKAIGRRGIRPRLYLAPALLQNVTRIEREFALAAERVLTQLGFR